MKRIILLLAVLALPAIAQENGNPPVADWEQLRVQAAELRNRAKLMRTQADKTHADAELYCRDKLLVAGCLDDARKARQEAERAIRRIELEAANIDQRLRHHDYEVKLERRREKAQPQQ